jgi:dTDP-4-dehydrorhamnose 3,5-epimerase
MIELDEKDYKLTGTKAETLLILSKLDYNVPIVYYFSIELSQDNNKQLFIPRGFLHSFITLENNTIFSYMCDNYYNKEAEDGVIYNDKELNIDWKIPLEKMILSEKDNKLKKFMK